MKSLLQILWDCRTFLPQDFCQTHSRLFCEEHLTKLAQRLETFGKNAIPQAFPLPHLDVECTPSLQDAFAPFRPFMQLWGNPNAPESELCKKLADTLVEASCKNILVLLGQRFTPGSILDARAIPRTKTELLQAANIVYSDKLTAGARALTKHVNRNTGDFWGGEPKGSQKEKNDKANAIITRILNEATWANVFEHYKHSIVYEVRISAGYGVRWGNDGQELIGFLEPFTPGFPNVRDF